MYNVTLMYVNFEFVANKQFKKLKFLNLIETAKKDKYKTNKVSKSH